MTENAPRDDGELLAAYLADDLDDLEVRRLERRLLTDEELRRQLDAIHDTVVALQSPDAVAPPVGLEDRIRQRLTTEGVRRAGPAGAGRSPESSDARPQAGTAAALPWWRRPMAAVAALALLGVVAASSIGLGALAGGGDDTSMTAMSADEAGGPRDAPEAAAEAAGPETSAAAVATEAAGPSGAAAADPDAAPLVEASPAGLVEAPPLDDVGQRRDYLAALAEAPARAALRALTPEESAAVASQQRTTLRSEAGLDDACIDTLVSADGPAALRLVTAQIDGDTAVGAVLPTAGGGLRLRLLESGGDCGLVVDDVLAPEEVDG